MCCRFVLVLLLMCVADSEARVVNSFLNCSQFFYKDKWPEGFENVYEGNDIICQQLNDRYYFATFYLRDYRIPLYSAYLLDEFRCRSTQNSRQSRWFIEPQLSDITVDSWNYNMGFLGEDLEQDFQSEQAINGDYRNTNYDRGHLNPSFYQCDGDANANTFARTATFTLTNAVPQDPCFNRLKWFYMEKLSKQIMNTYCNSMGTQRFFITGVIPSNTRIPFPEHDKEGDRIRDYDRVNVPYAMWTAACCYSPWNEYGFSFSYIGVNGPNSNIQVYSIPELRAVLDTFGFTVQIFVNDCFPDSEYSFNAIKILKSYANVHTAASRYMVIDPSLNVKADYTAIPILLYKDENE